LYLACKLMPELRAHHSCFESVRRPYWDKLVSRERDKRNYPRKICFIPARYTVRDQTYEDFIQNISAGGALIGSRKSFPVGEKVSLDYPPSISHRNTRATGQIVWADEYRFGVQFDCLQPVELDLTIKNLAINDEKLLGTEEGLARMGKIKKKRVRWEASADSGVAKYKLYWSRYGEVNYNSDHAELGNVTEVILPDDVPTFPLIAGDMELGISAVNEAGNESDITKMKAYFDFTVPEAPQNIEVEDL